MTSFHPQKTAAKKVFQTPWFSIEKIPYPHLQQPYYRLSCNDSVVILAFTPKKQLILIRQYRPAIHKIMLEFPAGEINRNETPKQAIKRELEEETGYRCRSIQYVSSHHVSPCRINSTVHLFVGKDAEISNSENREKNIEVCLATEAEFKKLLRKAGKSIAVPVVGFYHLAKMKGAI